jgi:hypothetical protein
MSVGIFIGLLTLPLAPVRGVTWLAEQVLEEAEQDLYDEGNPPRDRLVRELAHDDGTIDEQERREREEPLLDRLAVSQARRADEREAAEDG